MPGPRTSAGADAALGGRLGSRGRGRSTCCCRVSPELGLLALPRHLPDRAGGRPDQPRAGRPRRVRDRDRDAARAVARRATSCSARRSPIAASTTCSPSRSRSCCSRASRCCSAGARSRAQGLRCRPLAAGDRAALLHASTTLGAGALLLVSGSTPAEPAPARAARPRAAAAGGRALALPRQRGRRRPAAARARDPAARRRRLPRSRSRCSSAAPCFSLLKGLDWEEASVLS